MHKNANIITTTKLGIYQVSSFNIAHDNAKKNSE
jgi:hypothetical protein